MIDLFDLSGDIAVVIGGTGVLGGAMAEGLGKAGARVAIIGRNAERGQARAQKIITQGGQAAFFSADALNRSDLEQAHQEVVKHLGPPTILVNAAGGTDPKVTATAEHPLEQIGIEDWKTNFDLNLVGGVLLPCQVFGPGMISRQQGSVINIASVSAHVPLSRVVAYSAAKAAVLSLTQFLAREWALTGVRVNSITPGFFPAEQNRRMLYHEDGTPTPRAQAAINHTPMKRFGEPHELVGATLFLSSRRASSFVTGADLRVDGGFLCQTI